MNSPLLTTTRIRKETLEQLQMLSRLTGKKQIHLLMELVGAELARVQREEAVIRRPA